MHSNEVVMMQTRTEDAANELDNVANAVRRMSRELDELGTHMEKLEALIAEAAQVEGPLSADLRERMADAVSL